MHRSAARSPRRPIGENKPSMTTTWDDLIASLPPSLESEFVMASADEPIRLAAGRFDLLHQSKVLGHVEGELTLEWVPKLSIRCRGDSDAALPDLWNQPHLDLHVPQLDLTAEALVTNVGCAKPHEVSAALKQGESPRLRETEQFRFYLVNFPRFLGELIKIGVSPGAGASRDRQRMTAGSLVCTIDRISQAGHAERRAGRPGYLITHVAEIRRPGQPISPSEIHDLLGALHWLFAFMRGARTGPVMPSVDAPFSRHWITIAPWKVDEPRQVESWLPEHTAVNVDSLFCGFLDRWRDPTWSEGLSTTLAWYIAANSPSTPNEARILLCQIALEVLASLRGIKAGVAHRRIRTLLEGLHIPIKVPSCLEALARYAAGDGIDAPECLTRIRNKFEHPTTESRKHLGNVDGMVRYQAAQYGLELFELSVLAIFDYRGKYARRALQGRKGDEVVPVPWA